MSQHQHQINCPSCGQDIDVNDILYTQVNEKLKNEYQAELAKTQAQQKAIQAQLEAERAQLARDKETQSQTIQAAIDQGLKRKETELLAQLKAKAQEEHADAVTAMQAELKEKAQQLKHFHKAQAEIERLKREKIALKDTIELEAEKKLNQALTKERRSIEKREAQKAEMKLLEKDQQLKQLKTQLADAHRKAQQGSMQLQGEVQELAIEDWLKQQFPQDTIEEIKKGARGADCLQIINTHQSSNAGTILYESKRTKAFQPTWIEKFKQDIRDKNADIGVLVTEVMPKDMKTFGMKDGIYICTFDEFKALSGILRHSIIQLNQALKTQDNKGDKMTLLYDYLTGNEFRGQIEAIVEGFTQMQRDLDSEKRAMTSLWKKREKQLQKVLNNTNYMYSSVKGIAGSAVKAVGLLELGESNKAEDDSVFDLSSRRGRTGATH